MEHREKFPRLFVLAQTLFIAAVAVGLYLPSRNFDFTLDDALVIGPAAAATSASDYWDVFKTDLYSGTAFHAENGNLYRPLSKLSFILSQRALASAEPGPFHWVNIILYSICAVIVLLFLRTIFFQSRLFAENAGSGISWEWAAFLGALLFVVFPSHLESVANIKHREEILACSFGLLAWIAVLRTGEKKQTRGLETMLGGLSFLAALLSKESALLLLPCMMLQDWLASKSWKHVLRLFWPYFAVSALYFALRANALGLLLGPAGTNLFFRENEGVLTRLSLGSWIFLKYYVYDQLITLRLDPAFSDRVALFASMGSLGVWALAAFTVLSSFVVWLAFRRNEVALWLLFFLISSALTLNFIPIGTAGAFRLMFTPSVFLCAAITVALVSIVARLIPLTSKTSERKRARICVTLAFGLLSIRFASVSEARLPIWENDGTLFSASAEAGGPKPLSHYAAGQYFDRTGNAVNKFEHYERAVNDLLPFLDRDSLFDERTLDALSVTSTEIAYRNVESDPRRAIALADIASGAFKKLAVRRGREDSNSAGPFYVKALAYKKLGQSQDFKEACAAGLAIADHAGLRELCR